MFFMTTGSCYVCYYYTKKFTYIGKIYRRWHVAPGCTKTRSKNDSKHNQAKAEYTYRLGELE